MSNTTLFPTCDSVDESSSYEHLSDLPPPDSSLSITTPEIPTVAESVHPCFVESVALVIEQVVPLTVCTRPHRSKQLPVKFKDYSGLPRH